MKYIFVFTQGEKQDTLSVCSLLIISYYCQTPTQQLHNLTRLKLDIIIKPNQPHPTHTNYPIGREDSGTID